MFDTVRIRILLPLNPDNYYGKSIAVENLEIGMTLFVGQSQNTEEMVVQSFSSDSTNSYYEIHTDKAILTARPLTRVQYKSV